MKTATIILWVIAAGLLLFAWLKNDESLKEGGRLAWQTTRSNAVLLILAFLVVGFVNALSPTDLVNKWIGPESGWTGLFLAEGVGMVLPGGPYVVFPLIAVLYEAGAGLGAVIALTTSWATQSLLTITFELPFMGWRFTAIRWGSSLIIPILAGALAQLVFS